MINNHVEASLDIMEKIEGVPKNRLLWIRNYVEFLEQQNSELRYFQDKIFTAVREYKGEDAA